MLDAVEQTYPACHAESHQLGAAIYAATGDVETALTRCDTRCSSGCMHGVVSEAFGGSTPDSIARRMNHFCAEGEMARLHSRGNCAHGVGHALMFVNQGDTRRSVDDCLGFVQEGMQYYCATGVFMERFIRDSVTGAPGTSTLSPCDEETLFPGACYRYKGAQLWYASGSPDAVTAECSRLEGLQRRGCFHGLGYAAITTVLADPEAIVRLCGRGERDDRVVCTEGVIEKLADLKEGRARAACAFIEDDLRPVCDAAVERKMYGLDKPTFPLYYDTAAIARRRADLASGRGGRRSAHRH